MRRSCVSYRLRTVSPRCRLLLKGRKQVKRHDACSISVSLGNLRILSPSAQQRIAGPDNRKIFVIIQGNLDDDVLALAKALHRHGSPMIGMPWKLGFLSQFGQ
jgi:hypothetical protein